jgi:hypothetical protein
VVAAVVGAEVEAVAVVAGAVAVAVTAVMGAVMVALALKVRATKITLVAVLMIILALWFLDAIWFPYYLN